MLRSDAAGLTAQSPIKYKYEQEGVTVPSNMIRKTTIDFILKKYYHCERA